MTAAVDVAPPVSPPPPRERQSKPVQEVVAPALPEPLPPGARDATTVVGGVDWAVEGKADEVEVAAGPLPPRLKDRHRSPVQGTVVAVAALLVAPAAGDKIELDTDDGEASVLPAPSERQSRSVQEVVGLTLAGIPPLLLLEVCPEVVAIRDPD